MCTGSSSAETGGLRPNGLAVLAGIVLLGLGAGAGYYHYKSPKLAAELEHTLAGAPSTPRGKLELWHRYGAPNIHHRLTDVARFSAEMPWLITHAVASPAGADPELWGIDCTALSRELSHLEGLTVVVELPRPRLLGRGKLVGDQADCVPVYGSAALVPDARARLEDLARFFLEDMPRALAQDIEGATLEIRVAPE